MSDITLLVLPDERKIDYADDIRLLTEELNERSLDVLDWVLQIAYRRWSEENYAAGWMMLGTDKEYISSVVDGLLSGGYLVIHEYL